MLTFERPSQIYVKKLPQTGRRKQWRRLGALDLRELEQITNKIQAVRGKAI